MLKRIVMVFVSFFLALLVLCVIGYARNYGKPALTADDRRAIDSGVIPEPIEVKTFRISKKKLRQMESTRAVIHTNYGAITVRFFPGEAPQTVYNFIKLCEKGFYKNSRFSHIHRAGVIMGGLPVGSASPHAGYVIKDEFNEHKNVPGTVGMVRRQDADYSASCLFYICAKEIPRFDGLYTVFARVVEGMDAVERIAAAEVDERGRPKEDIIITDISVHRDAD